MRGLSWDSLLPPQPQVRACGNNSQEPLEHLRLLSGQGVERGRDRVRLPRELVVREGVRPSRELVEVRALAPHLREGGPQGVVVDGEDLRPRVADAGPHVLGLGEPHLVGGLPQGLALPLRHAYRQPLGSRARIRPRAPLPAASRHGLWALVPSPLRGRPQRPRWRSRRGSRRPRPRARRARASGRGSSCRSVGLVPARLPTGSTSYVPSSSRRVSAMRRPRRRRGVRAVGPRPSRGPCRGQEGRAARDCATAHGAPPPWAPAEPGPAVYGG